jgi:hypothetical protein
MCACASQTKSEADELSSSSQFGTENTKVLHGDISQRQREVTLKQFRDGHFKVRFILFYFFVTGAVIWRSGVVGLGAHSAKGFALTQHGWMLGGPRSPSNKQAMILRCLGACVACVLSRC